LGVVGALVLVAVPEILTELRKQRLVSLNQGLEWSDVINASTLALIGFLGAIFGLGLYLTNHLANLDAVSLGLSVATTLVVPTTIFAWLGGLWLFGALRRRLQVRFPQARPHWFLAPAVLTLLASVALGTWANLATLRQLSSRLVAAPASAIVVF